MMRAAEDRPGAASGDHPPVRTARDAAGPDAADEPDDAGDDVEEPAPEEAGYGYGV